MKRNYYLFLAYNFFNDFILIYPFYSLLFQEHGISPSIYSVYMIIWVISVLVFELPSGYLADIFSRKKLVVFSLLLKASGYLVWLLFPTTIGFAIGFILWGMKGAFASGAEEAWIYDLLKSEGKESEFDHWYGKGQTFAKIGDFSALLIAGFTIRFGYDLLLIASSLSLVVGFIVSYQIPEVKHIEEEQSLKLDFKPLKNKRVVYVLTLSIIATLAGVFDEYWGLLLREFDATKDQIAFLILVIIGIETILKLLFAHHVKKELIVPLLIVGSIFMAIPTASLTIFVIFAGLANGLYKLTQVWIDAVFQQSFASNLRATITSVKNFLSDGSGILIYGLLALMLLNQALYPVWVTIFTVYIGINIMMWFFVKKIL